MILDALAALAAGYFLGGLPSAVLVARLKGRDIFHTGSGNMGAMNTARNLGFALGVLVFLLDVGKGAAAATVGGWMFTTAGAVDPWPGALACGVGAVVGHAWSPYVSFRGGKSLATILGAVLPLSPLTGLYAFLAIAGTTLLLRRQTAAALISLPFFPLLAATVVLRSGGSTDHAFSLATAAGLMALVSIVKHVVAARRRRSVGA